MTEQFAFAEKKNDTQDFFPDRKSMLRQSLEVFGKNKGAVAGLVIFLLILFMGLIGPSVSGYTYDDIQLQMQNLPPRIPVLEKLGICDGTVQGVNMYELKNASDRYFWFGTDSLGRDLFTRLCYGIRISLLIAAVSAFLDLVIGTTYGMISGYYGGKTDLIMQRVVEIINGVPMMVIISLLVVVMSPGLFSIIAAMSISGWLGMSRLVRANALRLKESEHVQASRVLGTGTLVILFREIFPNLLSSVIVMTMMTIPGAIFMESFLSFVGLGIPAPQASLGSLISDGYAHMLTYPYQMFVPSLLFALLMISLNLMGDGLPDDPFPENALHEGQ